MVRATDEAFVVVGSPHREPGLGGDSLDRALLRHLGSTRLPIEVWSALRAANTPAWRQAAESFRAQVRGAKHALGGAPRAKLQVSTPDGTGSVFLERDHASSVLRELLEGGVQLAQRTLEPAGITTAGQVTFALAGGGSQPPLVRGALEQRFPGLSLLIPLDPSTVVAQGATLAAGSPGPLPSAAHPGPRPVRHSRRLARLSHSSTLPSPRPSHPSRRSTRRSRYRGHRGPRHRWTPRRLRHQRKPAPRA